MEITGEAQGFVEGVGTLGKKEPKKTGTLYLKINDSAAELGDNAGELSVTVAPQ